MIADQAALKEIQPSWEGVEVLKNQVQGCVIGAIGHGGIPVIFMDFKSNLGPLCELVAGPR